MTKDLLADCQASDTWLQAAQSIAYFRLDEALRRASRAAELAQNEQEVHDANVFIAYGYSHVDPPRALRHFDEFFRPHFDSPLAAFWEVEAATMAGDFERAWRANKRLDSFDLTFDQTTAREHLLAMLEPPNDAELRLRRVLDRPDVPISKRLPITFSLALIQGIQLNRYDEAAKLLREAEEMAQLLGSKRGLVWAHLRTVMVELHFGELARARQSLESLELEYGLKTGITTLLWCALWVQEGEFTKAKSNWTEPRNQTSPALCGSISEFQAAMGA